jgi:hypothetical protein
VTTREERLAANEARFREINENAQGRRLETGQGRFVCECADAGCVAWVELDPLEYERIHENPRDFIVKPGHEQLDIETIVERDENFLVVEKPDEVAHVVDPGAR